MKTRSSSHNSPAGDRKNTIEVRVNRRSKRIKNETPIADSIQPEKKNKKRFNRSALVVEKEDPDQFGAPTRKTPKLKVGSGRHGRSLINLRSVLETGVLEGVRVSYNFDVEGKNLQGIIKGVGILCSCSLCVGTKVIPPSQFELHACKQYRHAIKHIRLENGKSLLEVIEICKASDSVEAALQNVISSLPVKGSPVCTKCNGSIEASSTENLLVCDSCVNKKQVEVKASVSTRAQVRSSVEVSLQTVISSLPVKGPSFCTKCNGLVEASSNEKLLVCDSCVHKKKVEAKPSVVTRGQVRASSPDPKSSKSKASSNSVDNKKKRGRPRKASSPDPTAFESNTPLVSVDNKKRRGRPKKSSMSALKPVTSPGKFKVSGKRRNSKELER
ncbi:uncharacterized protein LOC143622992 [Bidens hawaiensis]|uniref:uncharacterized protein LOC143622992 n=1 Tax=Bidens hawaiensis TaxID=980011 RepID=UPI00404ABF76